MIKKFVHKIPANSLSYLLICGGIILFVVLLGIIPLHGYKAKRSEAVKKIQNQIDEQRDLGQVYQLIQKISEKKVVHSLPNPVRIKLAGQDANKFEDSFRIETGKSGMMIISLVPDIKTATGGSQSLLYNAAVIGEFANFRSLLIGLGALPYIDHIEEINIKQSSDAVEYRLKIWIALAH
jgi:hypothetical protein